MNIERAELDHFNDIIALFREVARDMNKKGFMQWGEDYPREDMIRNHIKDRYLWIMTGDGRILATILITPKQDREYLEVGWEDTDGRPVVIHRLAVRLGFQGKGLAAAMMDFAEDHARKQGYTSVRLDTYYDNERAQDFYKKRGYEYRGITHFKQRDGQYYCYEKRL